MSRSTAPARFAQPELERFVEGLAATPELWQEHVRDASAGRVYEPIWDDELVNAWLICWTEIFRWPKFIGSTNAMINYWHTNRPCSIT